VLTALGDGEADGVDDGVDEDDKDEDDDKIALGGVQTSML
jgi:hypothetical protein